MQLCTFRSRALAHSAVVKLLDAFHRVRLETQVQLPNVDAESAPMIHKFK